jgi:imidazolonepropionase-like amidohydrolase
MIRPARSIVRALLSSWLLCAAAPAAVLINDVVLIDGTGRPARSGQYVLVDNERIVAIKDHAIHAPAGTTVIDGRGKFLMPGMADTHIHLDGGHNAATGEPDMDTVTGRRLLQGYLYRGVTFVYDAANYDQYIFAMRDAERSGRMLSPRIFATGYGIGWTKGYGGTGPGAINTYEQGTQALDKLFVNKPDLVKFFYAPRVLNDPTLLPAFDPAVMHRLIMYANDRGFRTTIHAVEDTTQRTAVEEGINALAHPVYITDTDDKLPKLIATRGVPVTTTLVVLTNIFKLVDDPAIFDAPGYRELLTAKDLAHFRDADRARYQSKHLDVWARDAFGKASANVRKLYDAGATLALGTDRSVGEYVIEELEAIVGLGIAPLQALRIATLNAAVYLHVEDRLGSVEEGKLADLVLLNADPTKDIRNVRAVSAVILGGKIVDRSTLELPVNHRAMTQ